MLAMMLLTAYMAATSTRAHSATSGSAAIRASARSGSMFPAEPPVTRS
jgi:hypothetical protein